MLLTMGGIPLTYVTMVLAGGITTFTDKTNPSISQALWFNVGFLIVFGLMFLASMGYGICMSCKDYSGDAKAQISASLYWFSWSFLAAFMTGIAGWYEYTNRTEDVYQDKLATLSWGATLPLIFVITGWTGSVWNRMGEASSS